MKSLFAACLTASSALLAGVISQAADVNFINGGDFNTPANWSDGLAPGAVPGDNHFVQNGLTATFSGGTVSMGKLIVSDSSPGTLNMTGGDLTVGGGNESFAIGRSLNGDGAVTLSGGAILRTASGDSSFVGQRDKGVLTVEAGASVLSPGSVWRIGQFGPVIDAGLEGDGLLDVAGTFSANLMFLGVDDGDGVLRVRGNGSVTLTDNLVPNVNTFFPNRSSLVHMVGSTASLTARVLESANGSSEVKNRYLFTADAAGVSPITLNVALNITNNRLDVDLSSYTTLSPVITLFNTAPGQIYGAFSEVNLIGSVASQYELVYDNNVTGDIQLVRIPEPATILLAIGGLIAAAFARRRGA